MHQSVKALAQELTDLYSEKYAIPIEIRTRNQFKFSAINKADRILVTIGDKQDLFNPKTEYEIKNAKALDDFIKKLVDTWGHQYTDGVMEEINSTGDLKSMVAEWAATMNIPVPKVRIGDTLSSYGSFRPTEGATGNMMLNEFLKFVPDYLAEQTVVHEMCHAKEWFNWVNDLGEAEAIRKHNRSDHDEEFWGLFDKYLPDHRDRFVELEKMYVATFGTKPSED